ncbi:Uncharacterised protein [Legionella pneumophila]|nr:hypothetical protein ULM_26020 [Legionella pneumophila]RYX41288.1 hypothetical protein D7275_10245 [Legionella pneumophila]TIH05356.1 hypothetical protein DI137_00145 [Legionella pneumophila]CZG32364.1 Uncharacterised protein [Legionella pneumophila]CZG85512.1 Uncharacterised protein [Legionella pneumophila]
MKIPRQHKANLDSEGKKLTQNHLLGERKNNLDFLGQSYLSLVLMKIFTEIAINKKFCAIILTS